MFLWLILIVLMPIPIRLRYLHLLHLLRLENQGIVQMGGTGLAWTASKNGQCLYSI